MTETEKRLNLIEERLEGIEASLSVFTSILDNHVNTQTEAFNSLRVSVEDKIRGLETLVSAKGEVSRTKFKVLSWVVGALLIGVITFAVYAAIMMLRGG